AEARAGLISCEASSPALRPVRWTTRVVLPRRSAPSIVAMPEQQESARESFFIAVLLGLPAIGGHALAFAWVRRNLRRLRLAPLLTMQCLVAAASSVEPILLGVVDSGWRV